VGRRRESAAGPFLREQLVNAAIVVAFVGLVSALLGATAQHLYTRLGEARRHYRDLQTQAYVDFLKAVAGIAMAQRREMPDKEFEASVLLTDAKARIAIYGSARVASAAAAFFHEHGVPTSEAPLRSFTELISFMRAEGPAGAQEIPPVEIFHLLFS
jgi:hypothetical protein